MHDIYLAGPFFSPEQKAVADTVESVCKLQQRTFFSPRLECLCPPDASKSQRASSFAANCRGIQDARVVLACVDGYDPGTIWEIGFAFARHVPVVAYSMVPGRKLNLMLAESCNGFLNGVRAIEQFMECDEDESVGPRTFRWPVAKAWSEEIE